MDGFGKHERMVDPLTEDLLGFIDAAPTPLGATAEAARRLTEAGFEPVAADGDWRDLPRGVCRRAGALVAWVTDGGGPPEAFRVVGAHTDSPNLRLKPRPDTGRAGWRQLGVEVYGGALVNSWLDRDLGLAGRLALTDGSVVEVRVDRPVARVPQLAIHLDREVWDRGLTLNRQSHLTPVWALGEPREGELVEFVAEAAGVPAASVAGFDLSLFDLAPATVLGADGSMYAAARIDNLASCHAAVNAICGATPDGETAVIVLFDHEEVGSQTATGAMGPLLSWTLERLVTASGGDRDHLLRALARSWCVSADGAHAVHPNYPDRHDPDHHVHLNRGPVIKVNANARYASDGESQAVFLAACRAAGVPHQWYVHRNDLPCGSTIGPLTAAVTGIRTVDVGSAQLSMHSCRELGGTADPPLLTAALEAFLSGA